VANVAHPKHNAAMSHGRLVGLTNPPVRGDGGAAWGSVASEAGRGTRRAGRVETDEGRAALGGSSGGGGFETHHHGNAVPRVSSRPVSRRESRRASRARGVRERDRRRTTTRSRISSAQRASGIIRTSSCARPGQTRAQPSSSVHLASAFVPARCARRSTRVRRDVTTRAPSPRRPRLSPRRVARRRRRRRRPRLPPTPPPSPPPRPARPRPAPPPRANASLATIQIQMHDPRQCETPRPRARASRRLARRGTTPGRGCERARVAATTMKAPYLFHSTRPIASTTTKAPCLFHSTRPIASTSPRRRCSPREGRRVRRRRRG